MMCNLLRQDVPAVYTFRLVMVRFEESSMLCDRESLMSAVEEVEPRSE